LRIEESRPVVGFEVSLVVDIDLNLNSLSLGLDRVYRNTDGVEESSDQLSNSSRAPISNNLSGLEAELCSKYGVLDSSVIIHVSERKGLVDRRAFISEGVNFSCRVYSNADGKTSGDSGSGTSRGREVISRDAWNVLKFLLSDGIEGSGSLLQERVCRRRKTCRAQKQ